MKARHYGMALAAAAPAILLGFLAWVGRTPPSVHPTMVYGPVTTRYILAYTEAVAASMGVCAKSSTEDLEAAADVWIDGVRDGRLVEIPVAEPTDQGEYGVKGQIIDARQRLASFLIGRANVMSRQGDMDGFIRLRIKALGVLEAAKYSGIHCMATASTLQAGLAGDLLRHWDDAGPARRAELAEVTGILRTPDLPFRSMAADMRRHLDRSGLETGTVPRAILDRLADLRADRSSYVRVSVYEGSADVVGELQTVGTLAIQSEGRLRIQLSDIGSRLGTLSLPLADGQG
ncbi:MAG: hypothetical protein MH204_05755 [Fimbriimonadaceae bacterium]|nr:hypothetical protein [Fimbriimonadaceae bacterium]